MKKNIYILFIVITMIFTGCAEDYTTTDSDSDIANFDISIKQFKNDSRAFGNTSFTSGDSIRLFYNGKYTDIFTTDGSTWLPTLYWENIDDKKTSFTAVTSTIFNKIDDNFTCTISEDQSTESEYNKSDIKTAQISTLPGYIIALSFKHLLSRVKVNLSGLATHPLVVAGGNVSVEVRTCKTYTANLSNSPIVTSASDTVWVKTYRDGNNFYAIVPPQSTMGYGSNDGWIKIKIGDKTTIYKAPLTIDDAAFNYFLSEQEVSVNLNVLEQADSFAGVTRYVYGLNIPSNVNWSMGLTWKEEQGWFDVDKLDPIAGEGADANMCWAAAAANLTHWWLRNNKDYIDRYEIESGTTWPSRSYTNSLNSDVFAWIKTKKSNTGGQTGSGVNLYLIGYYYNGYGKREEVEGEPDIPGGGFATPIIGKTSLIERYGQTGFSAMDKETFNKAMKNALNGKKAIGFSIPQHALTLWGADFDESGNVSYIYAVDNNNNENLMFRTQIKYKDGGTYLTNSLGQATDKTAIVQLTMLDLAQDLWEKYFE